ncbi:MAG TPA: hypothetical protein PKM06_10225 [Bacillota bacterium]|nr:hypothetical protein [Peptococcaceae bacterium]HUM59587.1 hypothetical protein [Bacillota bacterium]
MCVTRSVIQAIVDPVDRRRFVTTVTITIEQSIWNTPGSLDLLYGFESSSAPGFL